MPGPITSTDDWPSEDKLAAVVETASLSENERGEYCRRRGVYPEHIQQWKTDMLAGVDGGATERKTLVTWIQEAINCGPAGSVWFNPEKADLNQARV